MIEYLDHNNAYTMDPKKMICRLDNLTSKFIVLNPESSVLTIRPPSCESWRDFSLISCDQPGEPPSLYQISSFMHNITSIFCFIPYVNIKFYLDRT